MIRELWGYVKIAAAAAIAALVLCAVFETAKVSGSSMEPSIYEDDTVILNHLAYLNSKPEVGDIIVFESPVHTLDGEGTLFVKRVAGVEGDMIDTENGEKEIVGKDCVYVLGDNTEKSIDSRNSAIGQIAIADIIAKVEFRIFPLDRFGGVE